MKHLKHLREASMKDITQQSIMDEEAKEIQTIKMKQNSNNKGLEDQDPNDELAEKKKNNLMIGLLTTAILKKDGIDELFEQHLDSDADDDGKYDLTEMTVKLNQDKFDKKEFKNKEEQIEFEKI
jgi:coenzyme F420-reducing hydrogenase beta subunit